MAKKVLVTGANGMLGNMLVSLLREKGFEPIPCGHADLDITDPLSVASKLDDAMPDVVVNCAAYTNVEKAETEEQDLCMMVNAEGAGNIAGACAERKVAFIQISSDYVFGDSSPDGHTEEDDPGDAQTNVYGRSKRVGEIEVLRRNSNAYILRPQWVFGPGGKNFVDTMLMLSETRPELSVVDDETGVPCFTKDISAHIIYVIEHMDELNPGFYHAVNEGVCNRYEQAIAIFELAGKQVKVNRGKLADYPRKAKVCNFSILKNTKLPKAQDWKAATEEYIRSKQ
jgi:dTDP-4-dehydrorhamnose reductase